MAKIVIIIEDCRDKVSPNCTKTFSRTPGRRGRPSVNCVPCRDALKAKTASKSGADVAEHDCNSVGWDCMVNNGVKEHHQISKVVTCPCNNTFTVMLGRRGRQPTKCEACRHAGTVYRENTEGEMELIRAEEAREKAREKAEQAGRERAARLCEMMKPIIDRDNRRRNLVKV